MLVCSYAGGREFRRHGVRVTIAVPVDLADAALTAEMAEDLALVDAALQDTTFGGDEMFAETSASPTPPSPSS
jgi:hypothetical protein